VAKTDDDKLHLNITNFQREGIDWLVITAVSEMQFTEKFSKGDFNQRAKVNRNDEVGQLSQAFNTMADELNTLIHS
jgi:methyl-accepting chemotaxis protein